MLKGRKLILWLHVEGVTLTVSTFHPHAHRERPRRLKKYFFSFSGGVVTSFDGIAVDNKRHDTPYGSVKEISASQNIFTKLYSRACVLLLLLLDDIVGGVHWMDGGGHGRPAHGYREVITHSTADAECPIPFPMPFVFLFPFLSPL
jgi:hypothetical protein